ncbi:RraA family protein [Prauserella flavalba]|uniref:RraA family protein n=1 Tax=Prauserella flavalba TaxID=1477506 RepID=UPI00143E044E|nr:hypothetical protein [Prauserella flavalba]
MNDYDHPQRRAVESVEPGQTLVMDRRGAGRATSAGHILITRLLRLGAAAIITDGSFRDSPSLRDLEFCNFPANVSAMTNLALHNAVDVQVPIGCAGVLVFPGDVLVGDEEGIICVPRDIAESGEGRRRANPARGIRARQDRRRRTTARNLSTRRENSGGIPVLARTRPVVMLVSPRRPRLPAGACARP